MSRMLGSALLCALVLCTAAPTASAREIAEIAFELAQKEMKGDEWKKYVQSTHKKFETWSMDNGDAPMKRYLDDKLVEMAPGVLNGNVKALKKMVMWVALYKEFDEPAHSQLEELAFTHKSDFDELLKDFSWERFAEAIKNRKKAADAQKQKKVALKK
ncbi:MAG TPA: hypothetical protein VEJ63_00480 [Planctomycetota bacterium]|nr:hypothetical protein [Planctomycetota bacterium]